MPCNNTYVRTHAHTKMCKHTHTHTKCCLRTESIPAAFQMNKVTGDKSLHSLLFRWRGRSPAGTSPPLRQIKHFQSKINFRPCWLHRRERRYSQPHLHPTQFSQSGRWKETAGFLTQFTEMTRTDDLAHPRRFIEVKRVLTFLRVGVVANCSRSSLVWSGLVPLACDAPESVHHLSWQFHRVNILRYWWVISRTLPISTPTGYLWSENTSTFKKNSRCRRKKNKNLINVTFQQLKKRTWFIEKKKKKNSSFHQTGCTP